MYMGSWKHKVANCPNVYHLNCTILAVALQVTFT